MVFFRTILIWFILIGFDPQGLIDFATSTSNPNGFIEGLAAGLGTKAGLTATWAHMVAGDIFVTRWIWLKSLEINANKWVMRLSIFFGIMLMPVGLAIHLFFSYLNKK